MAERYDQENDPRGDRGGRGSRGPQRGGRPSGPSDRGGAGRPRRDEGQGSYGQGSSGELGRGGRPARGSRDGERSYGDRPARGSRDGERSYGDRPARGSRDGERSYGDRPSRGRGDRPPRGGAGRGDRAPGEFDNSERRGGSRLAPKSPRLPDPRIDDDVTGKELDRQVHAQLRTLSKENAEGVAQHLVMVARLLEAEDLAGAEAHAETAVRRAGRVAAAREALGMVAYRKGDWARALTEFRTVRRLSGSHHLLPLMADCERGLGRHERALELVTSPEVRTLGLDEQIELRIVLSGIRRDLGQLDAAVVALEIPQLKSARRQPWAARLFYAYADALLGRGDTDQARAWFAKAAAADDDLQTDAAERLDELDGVVVTDLLEGEDEQVDDGSGAPSGERTDLDEAGDGR